MKYRIAEVEIKFIPWFKKATHKQVVVINTCAREKKNEMESNEEEAWRQICLQKPEGDTYYEVFKYIDLYSDQNEFTIGKVQI